jgi:hypothetical protein
VGYICWIFLRLWLWGIYRGSNVNTVNRMIYGGEGLSGGWLSLGAPSMHNMVGRRRAIHVLCI